jgi:hypothetical protein
MRGVARDRTLELGAIIVALGLCLVGGALVASAGPKAVFLAAGAGVVYCAMRCSPAVFLGGAVLILGTDQLSMAHPIHFGAISAYTTDLLVALVLMRAALTRPRRPFSRVGLGAMATWLSLAWIGILLVAAVRGVIAGSAVKVAIRDGSPAIYFPALYVGLARLEREEEATMPAMLKAMTVSASVLIAVFFVSRALNRPFDFAGASGLANVPISAGTVIQRDFGFSSAFIFYPALCLTALSYAVHSPQRTQSAVVLMSVSGIVTVLTLIRAEIGGLLLGAALIMGLPYAGAVFTRSRGRIIMQIAGVLAVVVAYLAIANPSLLRGAVQRVDPFASQAALSVANANYRANAVQSAARFASVRPAGAGFIPTTAEGLTTAPGSAPPSSIDAGYAAHSAPAWLLYYTGWPGLIVAIMAWLAIGARSFKAPAGNAWVHPAFVGIWALLIVYDLGASGLVAQTFVMGTAAIALAVRFGSSIDFQRG